MKVQVSRDAFSTALGAVERAVPSKSNLPILSHILLDARDGQLTLTATDLGVMITDRATAVVTDPGTVTLPAAVLSGWLGLLEKTALIEISTHGTKAHLESGRSISKYATGAPDEFPPLPVMDDDATVIEVEAKAFALGLGEVLVAAAAK